MEEMTTFITKEDDERNNIIGGIDVNKLNSIVVRVELLEEEKKGIADDIREIFAQAKSAGFDVKTIRDIIKLRKLDKDSRDKKDFILEKYREALNV